MTGLSARNSASAVSRYFPLASGFIAPSVKHLPDFALSPYWSKGLALLREVKAKVPVIAAHRVEAHGKDKLSEVVFATGAGERRMKAVLESEPDSHAAARALVDTAHTHQAAYMGRNDASAIVVQVLSAE